MDIGKRPSTRQRRQLPIAFESMPKRRHSDQRGILPILTTTTMSSKHDHDKKHQGRRIHDGEEDYAFMERSSSRSFDWAGHLRRRRKGTRQINHHSIVNNDDDSDEDDHHSARQRQLLQKQDILQDSKYQFFIQILVWISCGGWALFLIFRIVYSIYLGDYEQLNVIHFLTH
ncbi:hypothetical protein BDA99DRAFT_187816 [Phascolomyces articulosus]|uniref:Transmembrane protein n=1 Tax=Phascolomyces articulosus TaxID=60185 RepID=A0AAD5PK95_9FUNG|nr:hypothetical protein BDA99DRAFT_187816 [Phascolomyces articulosus]